MEGTIAILALGTSYNVFIEDKTREDDLRTIRIEANRRIFVHFPQDEMARNDAWLDAMYLLVSICSKRLIERSVDTTEQKRRLRNEI